MTPSCWMVPEDAREAEQRSTVRQAVDIPGRLVWRDARDTMRFASVVIRNTSERGAYVECLGGTPIPMYRLVHLQTDATVTDSTVPLSLRRGRVLAAVYRVEPGAGSPTARCAYGLRFLIDPSQSRCAAAVADRGSRPTLMAVSRSIA